MTGIFLSYSRADRDLATKVADALRQLGVDVWWDEDMPGVDWQQELKRQIDTLDHVAVLWTPHSVGSDFVRDEARLALAGHKLINLLVGVSEPPFPFDRINGLSLDGWTLGKPHGGWTRLVRTLEGTAQPDPTNASDPGTEEEQTPRRERPGGRSKGDRRRPSALMLLLGGTGAALVLGLGVLIAARARSWGPLEPPPARPSDARAAARDLVLGYFVTTSEPNERLAGELPAYYAPSVTYFGRVLDRDAVMADKNTFLQRWPKRAYTIRPDSLEATCPDAQTCVVTGLVDWDASDPASLRHSTGTAFFQYSVRENKIVAETSHIVQRTQLTLPVSAPASGVRSAP